MLAHLPRRPFSLDPLIAEARRRMRRRRALVVVAAVVVLGAGAAGAGLALGGGSGVVPRASAAAYPGPVVRLAACSVVQKDSPGCRSPDRHWSVLMSTNTYGLDCHVLVRHAGTRTAESVYDSPRGCSWPVWVEPHRMLFGAGELGQPSGC